MGKTKSAKKTTAKPAVKTPVKKIAKSAAPKVEVALTTGQLWLVEGKHLRVGIVGPLMVHYRLGKPDAPKTIAEINSKAAIEKYLKQNQAKLLEG
jgi:hypothetical protein